MRAVPRFKIKLAKDVKSQSPDAKGTKPRERKVIRPPSQRNRLQADSEEEATIFVSNLPESVNERDMVTTFEAFGVIERVFVPKDGPRSRGYGFVKFETIDQAQRILREQPKLNLGPYSLVLRPARPRIKG